mmetsp:Transcript_322/g.847  ORF Transcript_322/g.847 Transcript_322/m.847 type:complete len:168 (+) Transcript_322:246-749(+)
MGAPSRMLTSMGDDGSSMAAAAAPSVSVLVVANPSPSNPSTFLIEKCIESIEVCLPCLADKATPLLVVLDGYVIASKAQTKKGKISPEMVAPYEQYHAAITKMGARRGLTNFRVERLRTHHGTLPAHGRYEAAQSCARSSLRSVLDSVLRFTFSRRTPRLAATRACK